MSNNNIEARTFQLDHRNERYDVVYNIYGSLNLVICTFPLSCLTISQI